MALTVYYTGQLLHTLSTYRTRFTTLTVWSICGTIPRALCEAIGISDEDVSTKRSHLTSDSSEGEDPMQLVSVERASQRSERHSRRQETIFYYQESLSARHIQESGHVNIINLQCWALFQISTRTKYVPITTYLSSYTV